MLTMLTMLTMAASSGCASTTPPATPLDRQTTAAATAANAGGESSASAGAKAGDEAESDRFLWLEAVDGPRALEWVRDHNQRTKERLTESETFRALHADALEVLNSKSRIPGVTIRGKQLYNFWRDEQHPRGIYRRTRLAQYEREQPKWTTVLDIDRLSAEEGQKWVFKGMNCLSPAHTPCLMYLSPGGEDAIEAREFDPKKLSFVDSGYRVAKAKSSLTWLDADTLLVATDFGGQSLTKAKYPRVLKRWQRNTPLAQAKTLFSSPREDGRVSAQRIETMGETIILVRETINFWRRTHHLLDGEQTHALGIPASAVVHGASRGKLVLSLKETWALADATFPAGSVVLAELPSLRADSGVPPQLELLLGPSAHEVVENVYANDDAIIVHYLDDVRGRIDRFVPLGQSWQRSALKLPTDGSLAISTIDDDSGEMFIRYESFTVPATSYHVRGPKWRPRVVKRQTPTFEGERFISEQYWATSADGTRVPYFVVMNRDTPRDGRNPTHIFGYGGFRVALTPSYSGSYEALSGAYGKLWLERGGVFVLANLRGGGEFGPTWHAGVLRENRPRVYEDLEAIALDLFARRITSPAHLGIEGRSNGGLLVSAAMTRRPNLYGAVVCGVPLTDMRRYHKMLAGELWIAEYGNPDIPEDWAFLQSYSPYHNLREDAHYPDTLFYTSTRDDRVHPAHARKMAAKMLAMGHDIEYYENVEGGHGGSSTNEQLAYRIALTYSHLWKHLARPE